MPLTTAPVQPVGHLPIPVDKSRTYILYYHFRAAAPLTLVFEHVGTFKEVIERAKLHCIRANYRFIKVRPFVVDLDEREKRINSGEDES
jgi:hypothetical protein